MQLTYASLALGLATLASAGTKREFVFPDFVPMHKRQTSGPAYQCHSDCGYTILNATESGYCDSAEWKGLLEKCLECANTYDLWPDYGKPVEAAAKGCGIDAVPKGASGSGAASSVASSTGAAATTASPSAPASSAAGTTTRAQSSAAPASTSSAAQQSTAAGTTAATSAGAAGTTTPVTQTVSGASSNMISSVLVFGAAIFAAASLM